MHLGLVIKVFLFLILFKADFKFRLVNEQGKTIRLSLEPKSIYIIRTGVSCKDCFRVIGQKLVDIKQKKYFISTIFKKEPIYLVNQEIKKFLPDPGNWTLLYEPLKEKMEFGTEYSAKGICSHFKISRSPYAIMIDSANNVTTYKYEQIFDSDGISLKQEFIAALSAN